MTTATSDSKILKKMLADTNPVGWLAAADYLDEQGDCERAEGVRERALLVIEVSKLFLDVATSDEKAPRFSRVLVPNELRVAAHGGQTILTVYFTRLGERDGFRSWFRASHIGHIDRKRIARGDAVYLTRRVKELVESITQ